jgi:formate dehydrogenase
MIERGDWQVSDVARDAYDLEGKVVGTIGAGRIGYRVIQRLLPFDCKELLYFDYAPLPDHAAASVKARRVEKLEDMLSQVYLFKKFSAVNSLTHLVRCCYRELSSI